jgi:hypothetical protein
MKYTNHLHSHRFALEIISQTPELKLLWDELQDALGSITDEGIKQEFTRLQDNSIASNQKRNGAGTTDGTVKSISIAINGLLKQKMSAAGWLAESAIFQDPYYKEGTRWRLDFSKQISRNTSIQTAGNTAPITGIAVEVAFNHGEAIAWNLLKPVLASELNHLAKETNIGTGIGVIICATEALKNAGGFDGAVGSYEKMLRYLAPMQNQLNTPLLIVGLEAPETFRIEIVKNKGTNQKHGEIREI